MMFGVEVLLVLSGYKGYHVHMWLNNLQHFMDGKHPKTLYATPPKLLLKGLHFEMLDQQVIGYIKHVSRVPYTIHERSGNFCVPLALDHAPLLISNIEGFCKAGLNNNFIKLCYKQSLKEANIKRLCSRYRNVKV